MLSRLFPRPVEVRAESTPWGSWPGDVTTGSTAPVTSATAMQLLAVSGCVKLISDSIATLPVDVYRSTGSGRVEAPKPRWLANPTIDLDFTSWATQMLSSLLLYGNAYAVVTRSGIFVQEVMPLDAARVRVVKAGAFRQYRVDGVVFTGEMLHIRGMMLAGSLVGLSPLDYAAKTFTLAESALDYAVDNFDTGLNMPGVIEIPKTAQPAIMREMASGWRRARQKRNRGMPGVLQDGATWKATGISNEAAQFLQTRQWTSGEIAGQVYMVDPSDLGIPVVGSSLTYGNLSQRNTRRWQVTFLPWITRLEAALSSLLPVQQYVKLNVDALLRADPEARWSTYRTASDINTAAAAIGQPPVFTTGEMREK